MATTVDRLADSDSPLASQAPQLTARFVNDALPQLNQLHDRAGHLTRNPADAEDLVQETMLRGYVGFNTFAGGTVLRPWLFRIMINTYLNGLRRAQHGPSEYLTGRQLAAHDRHASQVPRSAEFRLADYYRDIARLLYPGIAQIMAWCGGAVSSALHRRRLRLRTPSRTHGQG
jgi:RNA polymerase sigma-70 factor (ECF subfamily)